MAEPTPQKSNNNMGKILGIGLGVVAVGGIAYALLRPHAAVMVTDYHHYYPKNSALYLELTPSDKLASRFLQGIDHIRNSGTTAQKVNIDSVYQKDFKPQMSAGIWLTGAESAQAEPAGKSGPTAGTSVVLPDAPATTTGSSKEKPVFLTVFALKDGVTLQTVATDFNIPKTYKSSKDGDTDLMVSADATQPILAVHGKDFLMASTMPALKQALSMSKDNALMANPELKDNLDLLPANREGTLVALSKEFQRFSDVANSMSQTPRQEFPQLKEFQRQMQLVTPLMLGSITMDQDRFIRFDSFSQTHFDRIANESLRKDLKALYAKQTSFDTADMLPKETLLYGSIYGLSNYYDLYLNHLATAPEKQTLHNVEGQMKMVGLDLRRNVIGLFDTQTSLALLNKAGNPDVLLFLNGNKDTRTALDQFSMLGAQFSRGMVSNEKVDDKHDIKVINSPMLPVKVGFSAIKEDTVLVGTQEGIQKVYGVSNKKTPSLAQNGLYKELSGDIPSKATSVFFIDFSQGLAFLDSLSRRSPQMAHGLDNFKLLLGGIEGVAGGNTTENDHLVKGHVTVKLTKEASAAATK